MHVFRVEKWGETLPSFEPGENQAEESQNYM
jgi:hypothetical protein